MDSFKNYRSVSWSIEVSDYNLQAEFRTEYGCASEAVLDGLEASNSNTHLESYVHSLERSKRMLQLINSAIDLMRKKHEKGELYYWILYYTYLAPHHYANNYEILHFLELKGMPMSMRNYYLRREEAINVLSSVCGVIPQPTAKNLSIVYFRNNHINPLRHLLIA